MLPMCDCAEFYIPNATPIYALCSGGKIITAWGMRHCQVCSSNSRCLSRTSPRIRSFLRAYGSRYD